MAIQLTSTAFADGAPIPRKYTGEGEDVSPALAWSGGGMIPTPPRRNPGSIG